MTRGARRSIGLLVTLALGLLRVPLTTETQQWKVPRIGILSFTSPVGEESRRIEAFRQGLRDLGYVEGQNMRTEYRYASGRHEVLPDLAADLVRLHVDVIATYGTKATLAAKQTTSTVPIVMLTVLDPIGARLVASLAQPGGNITGLSEMSVDLSTKRVELLKEAMPGLLRIAVLGDATHPTYAPELQATEAAARRLGVSVHAVEIPASQQFDIVFADINRVRVDALIVLPSDITDTALRPILDLAARHRLPTLYAWKWAAEAGALMSYGVDIADNFRRAAAYVDKILKGAKPADLPVEQPTKFELVINLKAAKALGITMPPSLLLLADEVIQ
jgi:putative tryptophan/tyrosine transport system substrate-binding protein